MKKILAMLAACMLVFPCVSCNEKKQDDSSSDEIPETSVTAEISETVESSDTGDGTVTEMGFRELSNDDFQTINVALTYPDKEAPVTMTKYQIPDYDFGERLSPCKKIDDPSKYDPMSIGYSSDYNKENSLYMKMIDTPEEGSVIKAFRRGNKLYMFVNYDQFCMYCHEWALFCYDMDTKKMDEIYTYSDTEYFSYDLYNCLLENKLVVCRYKEEGSDRVPVEMKIDAIDLESGESEEIYHTSNDIALISSNGTDTIQIAAAQQTETETKFNITEYNLETGEKKNIGECDIGLNANAFVMSDISAFMNNSYTGGCQIVTENYSISTDIKTMGRFSEGDTESIKMAEIIYASEHKAIVQEYNMFLVTDTLSDDLPDRKTVIHTYDLDKMEHYITEVSGKLCQLASYNGDIVMCNDKFEDKDNVYYIKPELGLAFNVMNDANVGSMYRHGSSLEINETKPLKINLDAISNKFLSEETSALWIMEDKEQ